MAGSTKCPDCGFSELTEEYDVFIENDVIKRILPMENIDPYLENGGDYIVMEE